MSLPSGPPTTTYCRSEVLTREELARYELPDPPQVSRLTLYRTHFHSEGTFTAITEALEITRATSPAGRWHVSGAGCLPRL